MVGRTLGHYEIVDELGSGGTDVVNRARNPRLGREVAIKVLPEQVATDADPLSRFEREVKAVAALSHPNILAIHELGKEDSTAFAFMELLDRAYELRDAGLFDVKVDPLLRNLHDDSRWPAFLEKMGLPE